MLGAGRRSYPNHCSVIMNSIIKNCMLLSNMAETNYEDEESSHDTPTTAYGLTSHIKEEIEGLGLEEDYTALTVDLEVIGNNTDVNYTIEATDVYTELDEEPETKYFESSSRIEPPSDIGPADEEILTQSLEEELDTALKVNGKVVRELSSPDYDAF